MTNPNGYAGSLVASHPGNRSAERSGAFSRRGLAQDAEVQDLAAAVMDAPHTHPMDEAGAIEIAKLIVLIDRIDADLAERGVVKPRTGEPRAVVDLRLRASRRLADWLDRYGMNPKARAEWARDMAQGGLAAEIARRQAAAREEGG